MEFASKLFLVSALCLGTSTVCPAQARRLAPADFVVAGLPDNYPYLDVAEDTARIRKAWGAPAKVRRRESGPGDSLTAWEYDGVIVEFGSIARQGITLTTPRIATHRGLRVGDTEQRVLELYGRPSELIENERIYADSRESLHVITVTVRDGRVATIYIGSLWD